MAYLTKNLERLTDGNGNPLPGGKLRVYNANTTTPADLFTATGLTGAAANPIVADAAGILPMRFLAAGNYDIAVLTSGGVVVDAWDDVPSVGSDEATLFKNFTNSRFQVRGVGGTVYVEAGDADPDNIGGIGVLGGWNGTQATSWTVNAATFDVVGWLTENSKKLIGTVYTPATSFSSSTGVAIQLVNVPTGVRAWEIYVWDIQAAGTTALTAQLSYDSGATYKSGASDYAYTKTIVDQNGGAPDLAASTSGPDTKLDIIYQLKTASNRSAFLRILVFTPDSGSEHTVIMAESMSLDRASNTYLALAQMVGEGVGGYGRATHIKLLQGANLLTGKYRVVPLRGFGD